MSYQHKCLRFCMTSGLQIDCLDGLIYVHDLEVFAAVTTVQKSKGATIFEIDVQVSRYSKIVLFSLFMS